MYLVTHTELKVKRIIKKIKKNSIYSDNFIIEMNILRELHHECIPIIYDVEEDDSYYYMIEEYIEGVNLYTLITSGGCLNESEAIGYGIQLTSLIAFLHSKESNPILFLDLQPQNIIINNNKLYLIDFGCSIMKNIMERDKIFGTPGYAAPEQYSGVDLSVQTDIYGIGALLYYMVIGKSLKNGMSSLKSNDSISIRFKKIILRCTQENKKYRYASADSLLQQLESIKSAKKLQKNNRCDSSEPLYITVAGVEAKVGATHIAFMLVRFLKEQGYDVMYVEKNVSGHMGAFKAFHCDCICKAGRYLYKGIKILPYYGDCVELLCDAEVIVVDEGVYDTSNSVFRECTDITLLVSGSSEWEIQHTKKLLDKEGNFSGIIINKCNADWCQVIEEYLCLVGELYYYSSNAPMTGNVDKLFFTNLLKNIKGIDFIINENTLHKKVITYIKGKYVQIKKRCKV